MNGFEFVKIPECIRTEECWMGSIVGDDKFIGDSPL